MWDSSPNLKYRLRYDVSFKDLSSTGAPQAQSPEQRTSYPFWNVKNSGKFSKGTNFTLNYLFGLKIPCKDFKPELVGSSQFPNQLQNNRVSRIRRKKIRSEVLYLFGVKVLASKQIQLSSNSWLLLACIKEWQFFFRLRVPLFGTKLAKNKTSFRNFPQITNFIPTLIVQHP